MDKLKRCNIVAPDDGSDIGWDVEYDEKGDMVYYDDVKNLEKEIKELREKVKSLEDTLDMCWLTPTPLNDL